VNRFPVHAGNDVARLQAGLFRGAACLHALQNDPVRCAKFLQNDRIGALCFREAYANRAKIYQQSNNYSSAIGDYVQAIRINPNYAAAYYGRGSVRRSLGDKAGAISDYEKAGKIFLDQGLTGGYKDSQFEIEKLK